MIVLPDSSSNDYEEHDILSEMGYDIVCLDHHEAHHYSEHAIVINNQLSENYPNKSLSGVGVVWKFLQYYDEMEKWNYANDYLDLVAFGVISDVMQMITPENRYICRFGLLNIQNEFLKQLIIKQSFSLGDGPLTQIGMAFYLTPLVNALIRVGSPIEKERLFLALVDGEQIVDGTKRGHAPGDKETIIEQTLRNCTNAKNKQTREKEKAMELLDIQIIENCLDENKILILDASELNTPTTLTGLCAMGMVSKYKKPTLLGRRCSDGYLRGSIRGLADSELKDFRQFLLDSGLMEYVEGHSGAAGYGMKISNVDKLNEYANEKLKDIDFNEGMYEVDFCLTAAAPYIKELIINIVKNKEYFGQGNPEPIIYVQNVPIVDFKIQGANKNTVLIKNNGIDYLRYRDTELAEKIQSGKYKYINIVGRANENVWMNRVTQQIVVDGYELIKEDLMKGF